MAKALGSLEPIGNSRHNPHDAWKVRAMRIEDWHWVSKPRWYVPMKWVGKERWYFSSDTRADFFTQTPPVHGKAAGSGEDRGLEALGSMFGLVL